MAMFETMTDTSKVEPKIEDKIEVEGFDEQSLLYNWLESLIVKFEMTGNLYSKFKITDIEKIDGGFRLKAKVWGEQFNPEKHPQKVGIKAVTYHRMEIKKEPEKVTVKFLLDLYYLIRKVISSTKVSGTIFRFPLRVNLTNPSFFRTCKS